jgi:hypothetical protein
VGGALAERLERKVDARCGAVQEFGGGDQFGEPPSRRVEHICEFAADSLCETGTSRVQLRSITAWQPAGAKPQPSQSNISICGQQILAQCRSPWAVAQAGVLVSRQVPGNLGMAQSR